MQNTSPHKEDRLCDKVAHCSSGTSGGKDKMSAIDHQPRWAYIDVRRFVCWLTSTICHLHCEGNKCCDHAVC